MLSTSGPQLMPGQDQASLCPWVFESTSTTKPVSVLKAINLADDVRRGETTRLLTTCCFIQQQQTISRVLICIQNILRRFLHHWCQPKSPFVPCIHLCTCVTTECHGPETQSCPTLCRNTCQILEPPNQTHLSKKPAKLCCPSLTPKHIPSSTGLPNRHCPGVSPKSRNKNHIATPLPPA